MARRFVVHPVNPQARLIRQAVAVLRDDGLIVYPTDSCYAFGCRIGAREPVERIDGCVGFDSGRSVNADRRSERARGQLGERSCLGDDLGAERKAWIGFDAALGERRAAAK